MRKRRKIQEVKITPQTTGSIKYKVQSVHMHSSQTRDLTVQNNGQGATKKGEFSHYWDKISLPKRM